MVGVLMISIALVLENNETIGLGNVSINEFDINNMAAATNEITKGHKEMPSYEFKKVKAGKSYFLKFESFIRLTKSNIYAILN
jgi:hypothetical protein